MLSGIPERFLRLVGLMSVLAGIAAVPFLGCSGQQTNGDQGVQPTEGEDAEGAEPSTPDGGSEAGESPSDFEAGNTEKTVGMFLGLGIVELMGRQIGTLAGGFYSETDYGPWNPDKPPFGLAPDSCRKLGVAPPECKTAADCKYTGQLCQLRKDGSGSPIPNSGVCVNPTGGAIDVGPITVGGFKDGPRELKYNSQNSGAYTIGGVGNGQLQDTSVLNKDSDYTIQGNGNPAQGLGAFSGSVYLPAALSLLEPVPQPAMFGKEIAVDTKVDLKLKWEGSSKGTILINFNADKVGIECLALDDGEFVIPAADMKDLVLSTTSLMNNVGFERRTFGTAVGPGLVNPRIFTLMSFQVFAKPK